MTTAAGLNDAQMKAVLHKEGPALILAGAGSGKTRVIVYRIAELIKYGIRPEKILAVTFTNKAAEEMRSRVLGIIRDDFALSPYDSPKTMPFIGTFHALSLHIIKTFHKKANLPLRFTIYDRQDSVSAVREAITAVGFDPKQLEPRLVLSRMGKYKGKGVSLEEYRESYASSYIDEAIGEVWEEYRDALKRDTALDFDDILVVAHDLLKNHAEVRTFFQNAWEYVHVDEYQDTNDIQYAMVKIITGEKSNIMAVGDADQNIYSWRGASIEHILAFEHDFPGTTVIPLVQNYRSTKNIIMAANDAIAKNKKRKEKELYTHNDDGDLITVGGFMNESAEAAFVAREAASCIHAGVNPNDIAVLYRANFQSRILEEEFLKMNIPYQVLGTRFFERKEVKDALAYIRLARNPTSVADFVRAVQTPSRGIGKVTLAKVIARKEDELPAAARGKLQAFRQTISRIAAAIEREKASEVIRIALAASGLSHLYEHGGGDDTERLENLKELVTVASKYDQRPPGEGIDALLEEAALQSDQDEMMAAAVRAKKDGVKLMTVHAAKGLEFEIVFITGLEDGLFPHERDDADTVDEEEERRLFYVALTRAKKKAVLSYAATRRIFGTRVLNTASEFITELDPSVVEIVAYPVWSDDDPSIS